VTDHSYFIIACARSGTTSLAQILNKATNGECIIEPTPSLQRETRLAMDGKLEDPIPILREKVLPRVEKAECEIYGEKDVIYAPFITHLYKLLGCKFVYMTRDGRDVVRSLMDWHEQIFGTIYRECQYIGNISEVALESASNLLISYDGSDYSRPRPLPDDPLYEEWEELTREEMCAYYWSYINNLYQTELNKIPPDAWIKIDYTHPASKDILKVADFLKLEGIEEETVEKLLNKKINSLNERFKLNPSYPNWMNWNSDKRDRFDRIASQAMFNLNYYSNWQTRWKPENYGRTWIQEAKPPSWYEEIYEARIRFHTHFINWIHEKEPINSIVDFGCGLGIGYSEAFKEKKYTGLDISPQNIEWCNQNNKNPLHQYLNLDFIENPPNERYDVAVSSGTIDNTYDIDACLKALVQTSRKHIYLTAYRGYFPDLHEHKYSWSPKGGCFYNDISPTRAHITLTKLGCHEIVVQDLPLGDKIETLITAEVRPK